MPKNELPEKCPICCADDLSYCIVDLFTCNICGHIFKFPTKEHAKIFTKQLHLFADPIAEIRKKTKNLDKTDDITFVFPSMLFYDLDLYPSKFYKSDYNHYFNQTSLIIFLRRCNLVPIAQLNTWAGPTAKTRIKCMKDII
jgi:hypothetical protein